MSTSFGTIVNHVDIEAFPAGFVAWLPLKPNNSENYIDALENKGWFLCNGSVIYGITEELYPDFFRAFSGLLNEGDNNTYTFTTPDLKSKTMVGVDNSHTEPGVGTNGGVLPKLYGTFPTYDRGQFLSYNNVHTSGGFKVKSLYTTPAEHKHVGNNAAVIEFDSSRCSSIYSGESSLGATPSIIPDALYAYPFIHLC